MVGNDHDNRPRQDRQYREGLMTGLLIAWPIKLDRGGRRPSSLPHWYCWE